MSQAEPPRPPGSFDERLKSLRDRYERASDGTGPSGRLPMSFLGLAFRIGVELVSALIVGVGFGWLLDRWLGTKPWLMVVFFFLGGAAGVLNVYRAVGRMGPPPAGGGEDEEGGSGRRGGG
ncbi:MAG: AtpZ/AtpI family protein [Proteobacteria bacterium]|nr:AtpZ/AtpI family protein [Pseudomonadota bacterium]